MAAKGLSSTDRFVDVQNGDSADWVDLPEDDHERRYGNDPGKPLEHLFLNPLSKWNPGVGVFVFLVLIPFLVLLLTASLTGGLIFDGKDIGFLDDWVLLSLMPTLWIAVVLTKRVLDLACESFYTLQWSVDKKKVTQEAYAKAVKKVWEIVDGKGRYATIKHGFMAIGFAGWIWTAINHYYYFGYDEGIDVWRFGDHPVAFTIVAAWELVLFVVIWPILTYKVLSLIYAMRVFFRELKVDGFKLRPMSPDGAGGLGEMGRLALNMEYVFLPLIVVSIISYFKYGLQPVSYVVLPVLVAVLAIIFWLPLLPAHTAMRESKKETLELLEAEFNYDYDFLIRQIKRPGASLHDSEAMRSVDNIEKLKKLYDQTKKMPVWPFDMRVLRRFSATLAIPTLVVTVPELIIRL